jgi:hypothetical protein
VGNLTVDTIKANKSFQFPSGLALDKGEVFYGRWNCVSGIDKETKTPDLVIICNAKGTFLTYKENFVWIR